MLAPESEDPSPELARLFVLNWTDQAFFRVARFSLMQWEKVSSVSVCLKQYNYTHACIVLLSHYSFTV